jgi:hypothetical protein
VRESRVSGEPHERWGAVAVAEFVAHAVATPPTAAVLHCRERLARLQGAGTIPPDRRAATHAEREAAAMKPAKAWVWKAGVVPVRAFYQRGPEAVSRPARPSRHAVDSAKYGRLG